MSNKEENLLNTRQVTDIMEHIHRKNPVSLTALPKSWQREINSIGSKCGGSGEHIFWAMLALVSYCLGTGATVAASMANEDRFKASANIMIGIIQSSGGGKTPVCIYITDVLRRLGKRIISLKQDTENIKARQEGRKARIFQPIKNVFDKTTPQAIILALQLNSDGKHGGMICCDEAIVGFPTIYEPSFVQKLSTNSVNTAAGDLLSFFDGTAMVYDTKEAIKEGTFCEVEKHGMVAYINGQPENMINSIRISKDIINFHSRMMYVFPPKRQINPYDTKEYGEPRPSAATVAKLRRLNNGKALDLTAVDGVDDALCDDVRDPSKMPPGDFEDVLFYLFMYHSVDKDPVEYVITGKAYSESIMLAFIVNTKNTGQGQSDSQAKFAAKANAKLGKLALLMHPLFHHYSKVDRDPYHIWNPPPRTIQDARFGQLVLDLLISTKENWDVMTRSTKLDDTTLIKKKLMNSLQNGTRASDPMLRPFEREKVLLVFNELKLKGIGEVIQGNGGFKYVRNGIEDSNRSACLELCREMEIDFDKYVALANGN